MRITSIVLISFALLTAAITVGDAGARPVSTAITRVDDCCPPPCPPLCPPDPGSHILELKRQAKVQ